MEQKLETFLTLCKTMLERAGAPVKQFGDSTEPLKGLADPAYRGAGAA